MVIMKVLLLGKLLDCSDLKETLEFVIEIKAMIVNDPCKQSGP